MMRNSWPSRVNVSCSYGSGATNLVATCPGNIRRANRSTGGVKDICMAFTVLGVAIARALGKRSRQNAQTVEVVEMAVRYIDGLQVAVVQRNPIRESLGLSHRRHCVY